MLDELYADAQLPEGEWLPNYDVTLKIDAGGIAKTKSKFIKIYINFTLLNLL